VGMTPVGENIDQNASSELAWPLTRRHRDGDAAL